MSPTIVAFLWRRHRVSVLLCCLMPLALGLVIGFVFPKYQEQREVIEKLLSFFSFAKRFFGNEELSMMTPEGAFCLPFQHPVALVSYAVLGAIPTLALPAGERGRGALDLLLATPLSRHRLVFSVAFFLLLVTPLIGAGALGGAFLGGTISHVSAQLPALSYLYIALNSAATAFCLGAVALLISALSPDRGRATVAFGVAGFLFIGCDVTARFLGDDGQWIRWLTPYGALRPVTVVEDPHSVLAPTLILLLVSALCCVLAAVAAARRSRA